MAKRNGKNSIVALFMAAAFIFLPFSSIKVGAEESPSWLKAAQQNLVNKCAKEAAEKERKAQEEQRQQKILDQMSVGILNDLAELKKRSGGKFDYTVRYWGDRLRIDTNLPQAKKDEAGCINKIDIFVCPHRGIFCVLYDNKKDHRADKFSKNLYRTVSGKEQVMVAIAERALELGLITPPQREAVPFDPGKKSPPKLKPEGINI